MRATPLFKADPEEYPEIGTMVNAVVRNVVEIMEVHDISAVKRFRKEGVFDRPYVKDVVTPLGVPNVPKTVAAVRESAGKAILDYLETIGITGLSLSEVTPDDLKGVAQLWAPPQPPQPGPHPVQPAREEKKPVQKPTLVKKPQQKQGQEKASQQKQEPKKEPDNGQAKDQHR